MPLANIEYVGGGPRPGHDLPSSGRPDNSLPGLPSYPSNGLPDAGDVVDPGFGRPILLPQPPVPDNGLPPVFPGIPIHKPVPPATGGTLPVLPPPGSVYPPLPPILGNQGKVLALIFISGIGARWTVLDLGAQVTPPMAPGASPKA